MKKNLLILTIFFTTLQIFPSTSSSVSSCYRNMTESISYGTIAGLIEERDRLLELGNNEIACIGCFSDNTMARLCEILVALINLKLSEQNITHIGKLIEHQYNDRIKQ